MGTVKSKLVNFWYYYKWHTLIALFFVAVLTVLIVQMATREEYDIKILYAGPAIISDTQSHEITSAVEQLMEMDYDGDGEKRAALNDLIIMNEEQLKAAYDAGYTAYTINNSKINENREALTSNAYAGEFLIFLIDAECYRPLKEAGAFVALDDYGITSGTRYDDYSVYLNSLDAARFYTSLASLPEDTLVCLRRVMVSKDGTSKQEQSQKYHIEFLKTFTEFKLPEGFGEE